MDKLIVTSDDGRETVYYSCDALTQGDYVAQSVLGEANRRYLMTWYEPADVIRVFDLSSDVDANGQATYEIDDEDNISSHCIVCAVFAYNTEQYFLREDAKTARMLGGSRHTFDTVADGVRNLEQIYPLFDDDYLGEVEGEWTDDALTSYGISDIRDEVAAMVEAAIAEEKSSVAHVEFEMTLEERMHTLTDEVVIDAYHSVQPEYVVENNAAIISQFEVAKAAQFLFDRIDPRQYFAPNNPAQLNLLDEINN